MLQPLELTLVFEEPDNFISELVVKMQNLGAEVNCNKKNAKLGVNSTIPAEIQISEILETIKVMEGKNNPSTYVELMKLYQKVLLIIIIKQAVEYYSAIGSDEYTIYLNKIRELIKVQAEQDKKVQVAKEEEVVTEKKGDEK